MVLPEFQVQPLGIDMILQIKIIKIFLPTYLLTLQATGIGTLEKVRNRITNLPILPASVGKIGNQKKGTYHPTKPAKTALGKKVTKIFNYELTTTIVE